MTDSKDKEFNNVQKARRLFLRYRTRQHILNYSSDRNVEDLKLAKKLDPFIDEDEFHEIFHEFIFSPDASHMRKEIYNELLKEYSQDLNLNPNNVSAIVFRADCKSRLKDYQGSIIDYNQAIQILESEKNDTNKLAIETESAIGEHLPYCYHMRSIIKETINDLDGAINDYIKFIEAGPDLYILSEYINLLMKKGDLFAAVDFCTNLIDKYSKNIPLYGSQGNREILEAYKLRAKAKSTGQDYQGGINDWSQIIIIDPDNYNAYRERGIIKEKNLKDFKGALDDYSKAIDLNKLSPDYRLRGLLNWHLKNHKEALEDLTDAISNGPIFPEEIYLERGKLFKELGLDFQEYANSDFKWIIDHCSMNIERGSNQHGQDTYKDARYYYFRSQAKELLGQRKDAIDDLDIAIEINPDRFICFYNRGKMKLDSKDYQGAINDFDKAIEIDPKNYHCYHARGSAKAVTDDPKGGCIDFKKAALLGDKEIEEWLNSESGSWCRNM
tara:strand:- start:964 stop:2457 length:1494 start_codon:yes stop_codon:yes gene_type:complete